MANIQKVIQLKGGNEYPEGRAAKRSYKGRRRIGHLFKHSYIVSDDEEGFEDVDDEAQAQEEENLCTESDSEEE